MIFFPNAKLNLGLRILRKREDGYHDLETVFYPIPIKDALEILPSKTLKLNVTGIPVKGKQEENLCIKAYQLLKQEFPNLPAVEINLHKTIPMGAGLGGGSSDAAFMLRLLNEKFELELSQEKLILAASEIGSDCAFFIVNEPCIARGRGEQLQKIKLDLSPYTILVVNPGIHIDTSWAFSQTNSKKQNEGSNISQLIHEKPSGWKGLLKNDFEELVIANYPLVAEIKNILYEKGAVYAAMTGSGSTVFGLFSNDIEVKNWFPSTYYVRSISKTS